LQCGIGLLLSSSGPEFGVNPMNKRLSTFLCAALLCGGVTCGLAAAQTTGPTLTKHVYRPRRFSASGLPAAAQTTGSTLTKHVYQPRRFSASRYRGMRYSPVKFTPRRYTWQRNLGKHISFKSPPKPARGERKRLRLPVRGPNTRRRAAFRRTSIRRRVSRAARIRTVRGGFGTGDG
jgi:hypothetical protein